MSPNRLLQRGGPAEPHTQGKPEQDEHDETQENLVEGGTRRMYQGIL